MTNGKNLVNTCIYGFLIIAFAISHTLFFRLHLPEYGDRIGTYLDDISYAMIVALIIAIIFIAPKLIRSVLLALFVIAIQFMVFAQWWNYEFYRDIIRYASLGHAGDWQEIARGFQGFTHRYLAIAGALIFLFIAFLIKKYSSKLVFDKKPKLVVIAILSLFAFIPTAVFSYHYIQTQVVNWYKTTAIPLNYINPVMQLVREKYIDGNQIAQIKSEHLGSINQIYNKQSDQFPFYNAEKTSRPINQKNVIIIVLESFRKYETLNKTGIELTPNFNQIAQENFTPTTYYANSNQTIKAEIAILCGLHDFQIGSSISAANHQRVKTNCLPEMLNHNGYQTLWFHGAGSEFFNRKAFLPKIGFNELHDRDTIERYLSSEKINYAVRHWGVEDIDTFNYAFEQLQSIKQPFFAEILTVSNHHPFIELRAEQGGRHHHPQLDYDPDNIYNRYQHLTHYTDKALGQFWQSFKDSPLYDNTVVVITGDHGIWLFDEDNQPHTEASTAVQYETYLRLPLTIYFPDKSFNKTAEVNLSQADVANIISHYLQLDLPSAYQSKLTENEINMLLNGSSNTQINNPVFSSIGDNYFFRNSDTICYPASSQLDNCDDYLRRCIEDHNQLKTDKQCIQTNQDLLLTEQARVTFVEDVDLKTPDIVVDYFRKSIEVGLVPESELLNSKELTPPNNH